MLSNLLFNRTVVPDLEKSMNVYSLRQKTISNNIANAMTPGYQALEVSFEEEYRRSLNPNAVRGRRTDENHLPLGTKNFSQIKPEVRLKGDPLNDSGLNNVDIDKEMAEMAENMLRYEMSTKLIGKRFANIKGAIRGRA